jgi:acetyltransferase-like isoleucine patch superfamily enzyme
LVHEVCTGLVTVRLRRALLGLPNVLEQVPRLPMGELPGVLRHLGAEVGERAFFKPGLRILAPGGDLSGLTIGDNVHFGSDVLLDLSAPITIGDNVAVGARVSIVTAGADDGDPVAESARSVVIHDGALIATSAVLMPGTVIGRNAVVAAQTMIDRPVAPRNIVAGSPSRVVGSVSVA